MSLDTLEQSDALRDLAPTVRERIAALGRETTFAAGEELIEDGSAGQDFAILLDGAVEVLKGGRRIAVLAPGSIVGEMALFNENVRTSAVRALEPGRLLSLPVAEFTRLVLQQDPAALRLMEVLGRQMVGRIQERERALMRRVDAEDPTLAAAAEEFAALRKRLLADWALRYHALGKPGKLMVAASKPVGTASDLAVAYSPGVAEPCLAIRDDPDRSYDYTGRGHLVGVVSNGTAVLGLGNIGALASKPVMEGKSVLFKRFADLDSFDIEVDEPDPDRFIDLVCALTPTFGGINLEDIKAPECFRIEQECQRRADIPIFHDDQHGTAIIAGAGLLNALELVGKAIDEVRVVFSGAGAAGYASVKHFLALGVRREHVLMADSQGVIHRGRRYHDYLDEFAVDTDARTLADALAGADVFVGLSAPNIVTAEMLRSMNRDPIVFALANPIPEIDYPTALRARPDVVMATGRSDYPNQINNVLAFPYIFRGALDTRSRAITEPMKLAATFALRDLARSLPDPSSGPESEHLAFGRECLIPKPFDRRLLPRVASAVAEVAMRDGVARRPLDLDEYRNNLARPIGTMSF